MPLPQRPRPALGKRGLGEEDEGGELLAAVLLPATLRPCPYQVAGHTTAAGASDSFIDGAGRFYKPLQAGGRGEREREFYERVRRRLGDPAFSGRAAPFLAVLPWYHGVVTSGVSDHAGPESTTFLVLEDVASTYARPCIADVKIGHRTWYPGACAADTAKWKAKDVSSTQGVLGWKMCGMQVWRRQGEREPRAGGDGPSLTTPACAWWRPGKPWCKALTPQTAPAALLAYAGGAADRAALFGGLAAQVRRLGAWAEGQADAALHSSSLLLLYEGDPAAAAAAGLRPAVRAVDFAHSFITTQGQQQQAGRRRTRLSPPPRPPPRTRPWSGCLTPLSRPGWPPWRQRWRRRRQEEERGCRERGRVCV